MNFGGPTAAPTKSNGGGGNGGGGNGGGGNGGGGNRGDGGGAPRHTWWTAPPPAPSAPPPMAQVFDDPHVRTLSGHQFFMHGVGVFDYATIPGVFRTQVYMCPSRPCTAQMMEEGRCLTYIQAVAIQVSPNTPTAKAHMIILRNNSLRVDYVDRKSSKNFTLGPSKTPSMIVEATGTGSADKPQRRINHASLANCHVLETRGEVMPLRHQLTYLKSWRACTTNEWTLTTPSMVLDIGVIGPFEEGFLNEEASDRTFNIGVNSLQDMDAVQGIVNGDKNGLFVLDPKYATGKVNSLAPGALVPEGPHGHVLEVMAANVAKEDVLFPDSVLKKMDEACGPSKSLRAIRMDRSEQDGPLDVSSLPYGSLRGWKRRPREDAQ